jgi:hypothetical protein
MGRRARNKQGEPEPLVLPTHRSKRVPKQSKNGTDKSKKHKRDEVAAAAKKPKCFISDEDEYGDSDGGANKLAIDDQVNEGLSSAEDEDGNLDGDTNKLASDKGLLSDEDKSSDLDGDVNNLSNVHETAENVGDDR